MCCCTAQHRTASSSSFITAGAPNKLINQNYMLWCSIQAYEFGFRLSFIAKVWRAIFINFFSTKILLTIRIELHNSASGVYLHIPLEPNFFFHLFFGQQQLWFSFFLRKEPFKSCYHDVAHIRDLIRNNSIFHLFPFQDSFLVFFWLAHVAALLLYSISMPKHKHFKVIINCAETTKENDPNL